MRGEKEKETKHNFKIWLNYIFEGILFFLKTIEKKSTLKRKMYLNKKIILYSRYTYYKFY